jgi:hypothetical protein
MYPRFVFRSFAKPFEDEQIEMRGEAGEDEIEEADDE